MDDERLNLPSASGYGRLLNCPGSGAMEAKCEKDEDTPESASGTRIHAHCAGLPVEPPLTLTENDTAEMCRSLEEQAKEQWKQRLSGIHYIQEAREDRLYLRDGLKIAFSGQPDLVLMSQNKALVLDYKTGFGDQQDSCENDQLRALAVLLKHEYPDLEEITAGIIQPGAGMRVELVTFNAEHLEAATAEVFGALESAKRPVAPLILGDHCKWCRAKAICPKQQHQFKKLSNMTITTNMERQELLPNETLFQLLKQKGNVLKFIGELEAEAKRRLEAGQEISGEGEQYALVDGAARRKVADNAGLANALLESHGITSRELLETCSTIKVGELDTLMRMKSGKKAKEVKLWQDVKLAEFIKKESSGKTLERVKMIGGGASHE